MRIGLNKKRQDIVRPDVLLFSKTTRIYTTSQEF